MAQDSDNVEDPSVGYRTRRRQSQRLKSAPEKKTAASMNFKVTRPSSSSEGAAITKATTICASPPAVQTEGVPKKVNERTCPVQEITTQSDPMVIVETQRVLDTSAATSDEQHLRHNISSAAADEGELVSQDGEISEEAPSERGESESDEESLHQGDERGIPNFAVPGLRPFGIQVGLAAMEGAMVDCLRKLSLPAGPEQSGGISQQLSHKCNICGYSDSNRDRVVEHMLMRHRMTILSSMQDLDRTCCQYKDMAKTACSNIQTLHVPQTKNITPQLAKKLTPFVAKIIAAGPGTWIVQHFSDKHKRKAMLREGMPYILPASESTEARSHREPDSKRARMSWNPVIPGSFVPPIPIPMVPTTINIPGGIPLSIPVATPVHNWNAIPPVSHLSKTLFASAKALGLPPPGALGAFQMPTFAKLSQEGMPSRHHLPFQQKNLSSAIGDAPAAAAVAFSESSMMKPRPLYAPRPMSGHNAEQIEGQAPKKLSLSHTMGVAAEGSKHSSLPPHQNVAVGEATPGQNSTPRHIVLV